MLALRSTSWVATHTGLRSRSWASAHTDQRPGNARASGLHAFSLRAPLAGYVSVTAVTGWKSCRCAVPSLGPGASGLQAAPFSKISESPARFLNQRKTVFHLLKRLIGVLKIQLNGAASRPEARRPREGSAKHLGFRHPLMHRNMSVLPATARSERARGVLGGGGDRPPPKSVWADAHDLDLELEIKKKRLYARSGITR